MTLRQLLRQPFVKTAFAKQVDLTGRHVIITGAGPNSLGYASAKVLASWGALVIITTRKDTAATLKSMSSELAEEGVIANISGYELDLCEADSVKQFVQWYLETHGNRLDILMNNAGIHLDLMAKRKEPQLTADGHEIVWRTNFLGAAHLTHCLLSLLQATGDEYGDARIVNVSSQIHSKGTNEHLLAPNTFYNSWKAYGLSKLAMIHYSNELHRRFANRHKLQSYALHPGGTSGTYTNVATKGLEGSPVIGFLYKLGAPIERLFMSSAEEGAQTQIYCATSPDAEGGHYYVNCEIGEASDQSRDQKAAEQLWHETGQWISGL